MLGTFLHVKMNKKIPIIIAVLVVVVVAYILLDSGGSGGLFPCGNGVCSLTEDYTTCPADCGTEADVCGNGICESESPNSCLFDCPFNNNCEEDSDCAATYFDPDPLCVDGMCVHPDRLD